MITKVVAMLEYGCYPVWLYDEEGLVEDTLLPEELRNDTELDSQFDDLQARYDALFINNENEFSYAGFKSQREKDLFIHDWVKAIEELRKKLDKKYEFSDQTADILSLTVVDSKI
ncbi:MAG TPA: hypothetical protein OIM03_00940 [Veillonellaceae bacterium]|nr:hypothetical protein [Veillonellaceae bacterium]